ncbi:hypothetical protein [Vibrio phage vB_VneS_J26]
MKDYFKICMEAIISPIGSIAEIKAAGTDRKRAEIIADEQLTIATRAEMLQRLQEARDAGRYGWWDKSVCSIDDLYKMRSKALEDNDHVSVINFTAMIASREKANDNG